MILAKSYLKYSSATLTRSPEAMMYGILSWIQSFMTNDVMSLYIKITHSYYKQYVKFFWLGKNIFHFYGPCLQNRYLKEALDSSSER